MIKELVSAIGSIASLSLLVVMGGCASGATLSDANELNWIDDPGSIRDYLAATGSAPVVSTLSVGTARKTAARAARNELAATLRTKVQSMAEDWTKEAGDLTNKDSLSSYINTEAFARQFVDAEVRMARVVHYKQRGDTMYALAVLDDPQKWVNNIGASLTDATLKDDTLIKTEVMKADARKRAVDYFKKQENKQRDLAEEWSKKKF